MNRLISEQGHNMWFLQCKSCGTNKTYSYKSNYNRALKGNGLCNGCSRTGQKRTPEQCKRIGEMTKIAMQSPTIKEKIKFGMSQPQVKQKMSENGRSQMSSMLNSDTKRVLWSWKIAEGTKEKWLSRSLDEKEKIRSQIAEGRKTFNLRLQDPIYKRKHVKKILCSGIIKDTKPEKEVKVILELMKLDYIRQYQIKDKVFDFYIPSLNLLIEVDGSYWHGKNLNESQMNNMQKKHKENDKTKNKLAISMKYNLERIWEDEITINSVSERILSYVK